MCAKKWEGINWHTPYFKISNQSNNLKLWFMWTEIDSYHIFSVQKHLKIWSIWTTNLKTKE